MRVLRDTNHIHTNEFKAMIRERLNYHMYAVTIMYFL